MKASEAKELAKNYTPPYISNFMACIYVVIKAKALEGGRQCILTSKVFDRPEPDQSEWGDILARLNQDGYHTVYPVHDPNDDDKPPELYINW